MDQAETLLKLMKKEKKPLNELNAPRFIAVASGKGGVGKTNLSTNLAIGMAQLGKEVIVMDADLGLANVNVMLGVIPKYNLYNVLKGQKKIHEVLIDTPDGISIIAGASGFSQLANLDYSQKISFIRELEKLQFADIIFVDTGAGISDNVLSFVLASDEIIIVTTPEPTSITDAYGIIKTIASKKEKACIKLIINRVNSELEANRVADRVIDIAKQFLEIEVEKLGFVYEDPIVAKAVVKQRPFYVIDPKSKASKCIRDISNSLANIKASKKERSITSFFTNLFRPVSKQNGEDNK